LIVSISILLHLIADGGRDYKSEVP
jgi:hypothetical protein